jgi:hypothetical protein
MFFEFRGVSVAHARYHAYVPVSLCPGEILPPFSPGLKPGLFFFSAGASKAGETGLVLEKPDGPGSVKDYRVRQLREKPSTLFVVFPVLLHHTGVGAI